jgi:ppGpp synthetase/RelA/SpoT-type nucleotidyltranferase
LESLIEKIDRKGYTEPEKQVTGLAGVRVITFIEKDIEGMSQVIRTAFRVHDDKSLNKADELAVDRLGYRSMHFVCDLGQERCNILCGH